MLDFGRFDLAAQSAAGFDYHVVDPLGVPMMQEDGERVIITLAGADSPAYKNRQRELARENTGKEFDRESIALEMLVVCTICWQGIIWDGKPLAFTPENARMLYKRHEWLRENVAQVVLDRANFLAYAPAG